MFWVLAFFIIILVSFILALRSMRDYQLKPAKGLYYSLFLIQNPKILTTDFFVKLHTLSAKLGTIFSFEILIKGSQQAVVVFAPLNLLNKIEGLKLLELEDYSKNIDLSNIITREIGISNKPSSNTVWEFQESLLSRLNLDKEDQLYFQLVAQPIEKRQAASLYQLTIRIIISSSESIKRSSMAQIIDEYFKKHPKFYKQIKPQVSLQVLEQFQGRHLIPHQVQKMELTASELSKLLLIQ